MEVLLVRHAHAGSKDRWHGDDRLRPLSRRGRSQARTLVEMLAPFAPVRIVSSPLLRCVQTIEPLSRKVSVPVEVTDRLEPDAARDALALLDQLRYGPGPVVACTHGETIAALQRLLPRRLGFGSDDDREKGSVWVLEAHEGRFTAATYLPPRTAGSASLQSDGDAGA